MRDADGEQVAERPVQADGGRYDKGKKGGEGDHEGRHAPLGKPVLLHLQDVDPVLMPAHEKRGQPGRSRYEKQRVKYGEAGSLREADTEKIEAHGFDCLDDGRCAGNVRKSLRHAAHRFHDRQLGRGSQLGRRSREERGRFFNERLLKRGRYVQDVL